MPDNPISRRTFVADVAKAGAVAAVAPMIVPRRVLGGEGYQPPSRTLNVAIVGAGGMGMENMTQLLKGNENVVAICDVDFPYVERSLAGRLRPRQPNPNQPPNHGDAEREATRLAEARTLQEAYTKATKYADFREMLDKQKDIDAVLVATPDHLHAVIAYAAMKAGKHVYVQKPLTYSVYEARLLARTAKETGVVTQMGNQGHSMEGTRRINELIAAGVIGPVREVHVWTDRPLRYWPQGIPRPNSGPPQPTQQVSRQAAAQQASQQPPAQGAMAQGAQAPSAAAGAPPQPTGQTPPPPPRWSMRTVDNAILRAMAENPQTPPEGLRWDLFLGPVKDDIPYHPVYHPFSWRGWADFGVSSLGDMGAHLLDQPYWALGLGFPTSIVSTSTPWGTPADKPGSYPFAMHTRYEFAARGRHQPAVTVYWYDGGLVPLLNQDVPFPGGDGGGGIFVGEKGFLTYETYGNNPTVYPASVAAKAARVPKTFPRVEVPHEINWAQACKGETKASCPFEYASRLTEVMLLGVVALRAGQGKRILYDGDAMRITNAPEANQYLTREYRSGWSL